MRGNITRRGRDSYRLKFDLPRGPDGKRRSEFVTVRGGKKDAQAKLTEILAAIGRGQHVEPSKITMLITSAPGSKYGTPPATSATPRASAMPCS
jgi:hypothetical protein